MKRPVCSVVISTRNCLETLAITIGSAATQCAGDIEVIVTGDSSSDGAAAWLQRQSREWPALRRIEMDATDPASERNAGIEAARSPLIAFLDDSGWWWPGKLAPQAAYHAAHPETAFSFTDYFRISTDGESRGSCFEYWQPPLGRRHKTGYFRLNDALQILLETNLAGTSTIVASKAALERAGGFRGLAGAGDFDLWLRLAASAPAACSRAITATHRLPPESPPATQEALIAAMGEIVGSYESSPAASIRHAAAKARARLDVAQAELARSAGRRTPAMRTPSRTFVTSPSARFGKETAASVLNAALYFISAHGAGK